LGQTAVATNTTSAANVIRKYKELVSQNANNYKGIIIDVRNNGGGATDDLNYLLGDLLNKPADFGFLHTKSQNGRLDYLPWVKSTVTPTPGAQKYTGQIVILCDNNSVSMSEISTIAVKSLPNGIAIGQQTWGGTGPITSNEVYSAGQFDVSTFMSVYTSSAALVDNKKMSYEGKGVTPNIVVPFNKNDLDAGKDATLEKALEVIRAK
jgi:C-terminal processing protease CtpA/Prc